MDDLDMALALEREESYKASKKDRKTKTARTDNRKKAKTKRKGKPDGPNNKKGSTKLLIKKGSANRGTKRGAVDDVEGAHRQGALNLPRGPKLTLKELHTRLDLSEDGRFQVGE
jgi:hypothetical protein